jgi:hypothetical protein
MSCPVSSRQDFGACRDGGLDLGDDLLALGRRDHRADVGRLVRRISDHERFRVIDESRDVVVVDVLHHIEALGGGADLAGI